MLAQSEATPAKHIQNEKITKDGLATLFKRPANAKANHRSMVPQDAKLALKMQQQFTEKTNGSTDSTDDDVQATKENVKSLFAGKRSKATDSTDTETTEQQQDAETQKAYQMQVLEQTQSQSTEDLGESRLGHATGNKRADVEHLFAASRRNMNQDKFGYMSNGQRKQLQNDFVQSANHQIELLRQMEHAQSNAVAQRSQESIQTSEHHGKWDELAYQNKLRGLFGAKKLKAPVKPKLRHKKAVNEFLADVKEEDRVSDTSKHQAKEQDSNDQMKQNFMDLIQEETSQFNQ